ncbi:MAG: extracellular solute-binding protein [Acidimicrobiales bacterium]
MTRSLRGRLVAAVAAVAVLAGAAACTSKGTDEADDLSNPGDCKVVVDVAVSSEKIDLATELAKSFNQQKTKVGDSCVFVRPKSKASGEAMQRLAEGWDEKAEGAPRPVIWSPASSAWGAVLDQRLAAQGKPAMAGQGTPFMNTPLVIAMPKPMAEALGWPDKALGWSDLIDLTTNPQGWAAYGHPEWGPFRLGKTNPNFSTSGLHAFIAQNYAAAGKTKDLTEEDLNRPEVLDANAKVESAVVHYGDTTLTFLNNWYRADQRGNPFTYASAVAVEEKSVIDYNTGNPDGKLDPGEEPRKPKVPLVAIYPKEGTLFSDNPFFILNASWVSDEQRQGAQAFQQFVQQPENQQKALQYNFRPGNPQVAIGDPIVTGNGVDPGQPQTLLQVPSPAVTSSLIDRWNEQRKGARVLLVMDISGSMGDTADKDRNLTKLELAQQAAIDSLDQFKPEDEVGLRVFSTNLGPGQNQTYLDLVPIAPVSSNGEQLKTRIRDLRPTNGTPLYDVANQSFTTMVDGYDATRINAVVLLTDGKNEDGNSRDDRQQLDDAVRTLQSQSQGENAKPVRLFTIGYGADADLPTLKQLAEATNGAAYNASDPKSITKVFTAVVSNF